MLMLFFQSMSIIRLDLFDQQLSLLKLLDDALHQVQGIHPRVGGHAKRLVERA